MRECGLKLLKFATELYYQHVTPRAGVWIETMKALVCNIYGFVTPRAGVWIETPLWQLIINCFITSLPVRECGLKHQYADLNKN